MIRAAYRLLSWLGTAKTARRGPSALLRRELRRRANRAFNRELRRVLKP